MKQIILLPSPKLMKLEKANLADFVSRAKSKQITSGH